MTTKEQARPLLIALKAEKESVDVYSRMAKRSTNPTGQEMYDKLVKEEKNHIKVIEKRLKKIGVSADTSEIAEKASFVSDLDFSDHSLSDLEVVEKALQDEQHAFDFYTKAGQDAGDPEEAAIYSLLANDEKQHISVLETALNRLKAHA